MKIFLPLTMALLAAGCSHSGKPTAPAQVGVATVTQQDVPLVREWIASLDGYV